MPDRRYDRQRTRGNRARYNFLIEIPKVLDGPAATPDDQHFTARQTKIIRPPHAFNRPRDFDLRSFSLHPHRIKHRLHPWRAPRQDIQHVLQSRARLGGHDAHHAREKRQRFFAFRIKQSLFLQTPLELLELRLQVPRPGTLDLPHNHLQLPARLVDACLSKHPHLRAIHQGRRTLASRCGKHHALNLRTLILERKIPMTAALFLEIRDLALDPQLANLALENKLHPPQKLRHRQGGIRDRLGTRKQIHAQICQPHGK